MLSRKPAGHCGLGGLLVTLGLLMYPQALIAETSSDSQAATTSSPAVEEQEAKRFQQWMTALRAEALGQGISAATFDRVMADAEPVPEVLERDRHQPEFRLTFDRYIQRSITPERVKRAQKLMATHATLLKQVEDRYGVQPRFLVSFWALESNFGDYTGGFSVIDALVTLAYDPRRADFFRAQLLHALRIIEDGHIEEPAMTGSWAGAMGQLQFIPSTFNSYAIDHDKDGKEDIWESLPDIFASAANFLSAEGWQGDKTWGREVQLPETFDWDLAALSVRKPLTAWQALGIRKANGGNLPTVNIEASLVLPAGHRGPAFLVYQNFRTTLNWNRSILYAIAVGHLADRIAGQGPLTTKPGHSETALRRAEVEELQDRLTGLGYNAGTADGIVGSKTREALKAFQREQGKPADGYPTKELLNSLRQASRQ